MLLSRRGQPGSAGTPRRLRLPSQEEQGSGQCRHLLVWFGFLEGEEERAEEGKREEGGEGVHSGVRALLSPLAPALGFCGGCRREHEGEAKSLLYIFEGKVQS